jgi:hypothetical protein
MGQRGERQAIKMKDEYNVYQSSYDILSALCLIRRRTYVLAASLKETCGVAGVENLWEIVFDKLEGAVEVEFFTDFSQKQRDYGASVDILFKPEAIVVNASFYEREKHGNHVGMRFADRELVDYTKLVERIDAIYWEIERYLGDITRMPS